MTQNPCTMWETWVQSLGWKDPLEESMATHSSISAWRIPRVRGSWRAAVHELQKVWATNPAHYLKQPIQWTECTKQFFTRFWNGTRRMPPNDGKQTRTALILSQLTSWGKFLRHGVGSRTWGRTQWTSRVEEAEMIVEGDQRLKSWQDGR